MGTEDVKVMGSIPTLVRVFLCSCVGPFPSVGLTLTWFIWDRNLALHITPYSVKLCLKYKCYTPNVCINVTFPFTYSVHLLLVAVALISCQAVLIRGDFHCSLSQCKRSSSPCFNKKIVHTTNLCKWPFTFYLELYLL